MDSLEMILRAGGHQDEYSQEEKVALATSKNDRYQELVKTLTPADALPGMVDFLAELKAAGYRLVLASASKNAPTVLKYLQLTAAFEGVVDPSSVANGKPAPDIYLAAAKMLNLAPEQVAGVEDAAAGVAAINAAGELSIGIGSAEDLREAAVRFDSTSQVTLENIKKQLN